MKPRIAPLAGAALLALIGLNGWVLTCALGALLHGSAAAEQKIEWRPQLSTSEDVSTIQKPIETYGMTVAHPIFYKSREPFVPPPPTTPPPKVAQSAPSAPVDPGLILGGVMTIGHLRKAYLLTSANPAGLWVAEGENFMGWVITSVDSASAKVRQQDRTIELQLYPQGQTESSPPPAQSSKGVMPRAGPQAVNVRPPMPSP
ncbi:MAG: hypothetical protein JO228_09385 [Xanthobacteraceae bacterium]|nr:hypothetical protein [Xanthobacteraceae bacterium]